MSNITQVVRMDKNMTTLKRTVIATGLDQVLTTTGPFTLFAPTDAAFRNVDKDTLEALQAPENKVMLTDLLKTHVVSGKVNFKDLTDGNRLITLQGKQLAVKVQDGKVSVDNATIQHHDIQTSNGVIHSLDAVIAE